MAGLGPAIHVFSNEFAPSLTLPRKRGREKREWMARA